MLVSAIADVAYMPCTEEGLLVHIENVTCDAANVAASARDAGYPALDGDVYVAIFVHFLLPKCATG